MVRGSHSPQRAVAAVLVGACCALAGCTGDDSSTTPAPSGSGTSAPAATASGSALPGGVATTPTGTPVRAPGGGNVTQTVTPTAGPGTLKAVLNATATPTTGITVRIAKVEAIEGEAQGPGEITGPAVAVTVSIVNRSGSAFDSSLVSVNLDDSQGRPGSGMIGPPADWITGSVPAGEAVTGVYVFRVPEGNRDPIRVSVSAHPELATVVFTGKV